MKYIVILGDGMADRKCEELGGKTPLQAARKPHMDFIASHGVCGMVRTVPEGMPPGSDTANLSVMGFDPKIYYTGRSPLEAVSMGISLSPKDVTYRCNVVTLSSEANYEDTTMVDYSAGEITTAESTILINDLAKELNDESWQLYPGISYRHCLVLKNGGDGTDLTPPHDISGKVVGPYLPKNGNSAKLYEMMKFSREFFKDHPVNRDRIARGLNPATSVWFWGEGRKPALASFKELYGIDGAVISAVDLVKGIGICAGLTSIDVPGATGNLDSNFAGKAAAAVEALKTCDFVYVHMEAPDECGHQGKAKDKVTAIELIDDQIVGPVLKAMQDAGEAFAIAVLPDHPTPICTRTHSGDPVPFALLRSDREVSGPAAYDEDSAAATGIFVDPGHMLIAKMIRGEI